MPELDTKTSRLLRIIFAGIFLYGGICVLLISMTVRFSIQWALSGLEGIKFQEAYNSANQWFWFGYLAGFLMIGLGAGIDWDKELPGRAMKEKHAEPKLSSNSVLEGDARQDQPRTPQHER